MTLSVICIILFLITGFIESITVSKVQSQLMKLHSDVDIESIKDAIKHGNYLTTDIEDSDFNLLKKFRFIRIVTFAVFLVSFWV